jgi:hypothetical protein
LEAEARLRGQTPGRLVRGLKALWVGS